MQSVRKFQKKLQDKGGISTFINPLTIVFSIGIGALSGVTFYQQWSKGSMMFNQKVIKQYVRSIKTFQKPVRFFGEYFPRIEENQFIETIKKKKYPEIRMSFNDHLFGKSVFLKYVSTKLPNCVYVNFSAEEELIIYDSLIEKFDLTSKYQTNEFFLKCMKDVIEEDGKGFIILENWYNNVEQFHYIVRTCYSCGIYMIITCSEKEYLDLYFTDMGVEKLTYPLELPGLDKTIFPRILSQFLSEKEKTVYKIFGDISFRDLLDIATINSDYGMHKEDYCVDKISFIKEKLCEKRIIEGFKFMDRMNNEDNVEVENTGEFNDNEGGIKGSM